MKTFRTTLKESVTLPEFYAYPKLEFDFFEARNKPKGELIWGSSINSETGLSYWQEWTIGQNFMVYPYEYTYDVDMHNIAILQNVTLHHMVQDRFDRAINFMKLRDEGYFGIYISQDEVHLHNLTNPYFGCNFYAWDADTLILWDSSPIQLETLTFRFNTEIETLLLDQHHDERIDLDGEF